MLIQKISIFLISFFNLLELFPAFICDNNTRRLVHSSLGVNMFNPFPSFTSSSPSIAGMSDKSTDSSLSLILVVSADSSLSLFLVVSAYSSFSNQTS